MEYLKSFKTFEATKTESECDSELSKNLLKASKEGDVKKVDEFLKKGADVMCKNKMGDTPLKLAKHYKHEDVVKLLLKMGAENESSSYSYLDSDLDGDLLKASKEGNLAEVDRLIKEGADVCVKDKYGATPLILACLYNHIDVVKLLLEMGADMDAEDIYGYNVMKLAVERKHLDIVKLLNKFKYK